jgi:hypothetical protein
MAQKTWKTYKTAVEFFKTVRPLYQLRDVWPAPLNDVMYYVAYLSYTGLSAFTILTYNSGSSYTHKLHSLEDNTLQIKKLDHNGYCSGRHTIFSH